MKMSQLVIFRTKIQFEPIAIKLVILILIAGFLARGAVISHGYAIDDYRTYYSMYPAHYITYFSQGRYFNALSVWAIDYVGASISGGYFSLGILALLLQSIFTVSILRFVGLQDQKMSPLIGAIINTHPYLAEIYTFRMALPGLCLSLFLSIITLELTAIRSPTLPIKLAAFFTSLLMLLTYQVFLNYFAVVIVFTVIIGSFIANENARISSTENIYYQRAYGLALVTVTSAIVFFAATKIMSLIVHVPMEGRTHLLEVKDYWERVNQVISQIAKIYWWPEPIMSGAIKFVINILLIISVASVLIGFSSRSLVNNVNKLVAILIAVLILSLSSVGLIMFFDSWWPVPRVVSHVSVVIGLTFLVSDYCVIKPNNTFVYSVLTLRVLTLFGFILLSNQIFADQIRLNLMDTLFANRLVSRIETIADPRSVRYVSIDGGSWGYANPVATMEGDMNISALYPAYSKVPLLAFVSGYDFQDANLIKTKLAKDYCSNKRPWPSSESVFVIDDLAIICLNK
jgi:Glucosyl transferase GtrII